MTFVFGMDGGASKSVSIVADTEGNVLSRVESGPSNYQNIGKEKAKEAIEHAVQRAIEASRTKITEFEVACLGLAGMDSQTSYNVLYGIISDIKVFRKVMLLNDAEIGLAGATGCRHGIVVNAGTGAVAFGINQRGEKGRSGGWGYLMGDEGSAYDVSRRALMAAAKAHDGRGEPTLLLPMIMEALSLEQFEQIIELLYHKEMSPEALASLAPVVFEAAQKGDRVSQEILECAGEELGLVAIAVARALGMESEECEVAPIGGMFRPHTLLYKSFARVLRRQVPDCRLIKPIFEPAVGAVLLALKEAGGELTDLLLERIGRSVENGVSATRLENDG
ncbi:MAG: N-acetylmuramic acid/N-acetylglucosamine kinase [Actinobacteria bacterium]|nr:N-acetylmuramic acid/N-acetylglucosamine kinase [Actinomycetota bacterium]